MLFHSPEFLFFFLPLTLLVFFGLGRVSSRAALGWLVVASLLFYGWWDVRFLPLLLGSILFNYACGKAIAVRGKAVLVVSVAVNLAALGFFKYANFFAALMNVPLPQTEIALPLGISFFTFTQIAYLVDVYRAQAKEYSLLKYGLFVSYFPHLIAGPILHHKEIIPQFNNPAIFRPDAFKLAAGLALFTIGLLKKTLLADNLAQIADPVFLAAGKGIIEMFDAWRGAIAYTLQIYFDFSGYTDMALGLSFMIGVRMPMNFYSPYRSASIIEFWRHWHMTLSRFLRDYLYIPLGGNRKGKTRRYLNLMITMALGGLWHGAAMTFILWGVLHGAYLVLNHGWRYARSRSQLLDTWMRLALMRGVSIGITFLCVVLAWVFFRAADVSAAMHMLQSMAGIGMVKQQVEAIAPFQNLMLCLLLLLVWFAPNSMQIMARAQIALGMEVTAAPRRWQWQPTLGWALITSIAGILAVGAVLATGDGSAFIYYQF